MQTCENLKSGVPAIVVSVGGSRVLRKRLSSLGIFKGASIVFIRRAPFGDPLEFKTGETRLAIRKKDARLIKVEYDQKKCTKRLFV